MSITTRPLFVAGEATTMPYKLIVIARGDGAKPERSAFDDHSIRLTPPSMSNAA
jgi:alkyl hydroperoxide reductase subunit AhpF